LYIHSLATEQLHSEVDMAHFAKLDDNNVVLEVNALSNHELVTSKDTVDEDGNVVVSLVESEDKGIAFLTAWSGGHTNWKQTSYNATFRGKLAGIGDTYDPVTNMFISPVVESAPVTTPVEESVPVVEAPQETVSQAVVDLSSTDLPAFTSSDVAALTSEQITGL
jgi:hypothetical protein